MDPALDHFFAHSNIEWAYAVSQIDNLFCPPIFQSVKMYH